MSKYCIVEFDGSSKGNPGVGGAGAVIRNSNGDVIFRGNKPLGFTTNNAAEYEGFNMGLEKAMEMGYTDVRVRGDSKLVCEQLTGNWKVRSSNLYEPNRRAHDLISGLDNFEISHVPREYNTEADAEANKAAYSRLTGNWKVRSSNLYEPNRRAHDLISGLDNFEISHVPREYNTEADAEANKASRGGKAFKEY